MEFFDFLKRTPEEDTYIEGSVGEIFSGKFPEKISKGSIFILEIKNTFGTEYEHYQGKPSVWRSSFNKLYPNNWKRDIYDLGILYEGEDREQFIFALEKIAKEISKEKAILIVVGGGQDLSFNLFKSIDRKFKNICSADKTLDLGNPTEAVNQYNWISHMILKTEYRLLNYYNFGSQVPYNLIENNDVLEQLNFFNMGLGKLSEDLKKVEPYMRDSHLFSVDMSVVGKPFFSAADNTVNGVYPREICGMARYAGLSSDMNMLHISNFGEIKDQQEGELIAEIMWYFIDAKNNMKKDGDIHTYRVQWEDEELVFLKSNQSERWWLEVKVDGTVQRIPCDEEDYRKCLKGEMPERWSNFFKRFF